MICALIAPLVRVDWSRHLTVGVGSPPSVVPHSVRRLPSVQVQTDTQRRISTVIYPDSAGSVGAESTRSDRGGNGAR